MQDASNPNRRSERDRRWAEKEARRRLFPSRLRGFVLPGTAATAPASCPLHAANTRYTRGRRTLHPPPSRPSSLTSLLPLSSDRAPKAQAKRKTATSSHPRLKKTEGRMEETAAAETARWPFLPHTALAHTIPYSLCCGFPLPLATWLRRESRPHGFSLGPRPQRTGFGARRLSWGDQELGTEAGSGVWATGNILKGGEAAGKQIQK